MRIAQLRLLAPSLLICAAAFCAPALAQQAKSSKPTEVPAAEVSVDILWYGVVDGDQEHDNGEQPEKTDHVPARQGAEFGVAYTVYGIPDGAKIKLRQVARYPAPGRRPPGGKLQKTDEVDMECEAGVTCFTSYSIEGKDEVIPGEWRLELYYRGKKVMEQRFVMRYEGV
jgi:hypothetical protein